MSSNLIKVGMADLNAAKSPAVLITYGLGSCVGVTLYDEKVKVGGLAHIMLPDSKAAKEVGNPAKFADTAIPILIEKMEKLGASKSRMVAKIAGGAQMFTFSKQDPKKSIGQRNAEAVREKLKDEGIPIVVDETGGNFGRTIILHTDTGVLEIKTIGHGVKEL